MNIVRILLSPPLIGIVAVFLSVVWMLRDEKDRTRPALVIALVLNLFYGLVLNLVIGRENGLVPWKYDHVLARIDDAIGLSAATIASPLQAAGWRIPLLVIYQLLVPMMITWYMVSRYQREAGSVVLAYIAEMLAGPLLYSILPACGPIYAFRADWLRPSPVQAEVVKLSGMPNAFPSLHLGTAMVFVFFARHKLWRAISLAFLAGTAMATLSTGEHYIIDLVAGLAFGCFAASVGHRRYRSAAIYCGIALGWSLAIRFQFQSLIDHPLLLKVCVVLTVTVGIAAIAREWRTKAPAHLAFAGEHPDPNASWPPSEVRAS